MADWLEPALRLLHYSMLLGLFGLSAYRVIGLRNVETGYRGNRTMILLGAAVVAPLASASLMMTSIAAMMGQPVLRLEWPIVETMVTTTSLGWAFMARMMLLSAALGVLVARRLIPRAWSIAAVLYALALMTLAWSGHAASGEGMWGLLHRLNDGMHLIAVGLWVGAIGWFLYLTTIARRRSVHSFEPLLTAMHRFAPLGVSLVGVVAATGIVNAHLTFGLANSLTVLKTDYGWILAAKIAVVGLMLLLGARNARLVRKRLRDNAAADAARSRTPTTLRASLTGELICAVVVLAFVAMLGLASPTG